MITFSINFENFKNGLKQVLGATSTVKTSVISNVLLKLYDNKIELVATDGNRIRIKRLELDATLPEVQEPLKVAFNGEILYNQIKSFKITYKTLKKVTEKSEKLLHIRKKCGIMHNHIFHALLILYLIRLLKILK